VCGVSTSPTSNKNGEKGNMMKVLKMKCRKLKNNFFLKYSNCSFVLSIFLSKTLKILLSFPIFALTPLQHVKSPHDL